MIRNIIFDWCGTLVDDLEAVWKATNQTFAKSGVPALSLEEFRREFSLPFRPFYERYTPHIDESQLETWYFEAFHAEQDSVRPLSHARAFLDFCQSRDHTLFVLSSIHSGHFEVHLKLTGFGPYFTHAYVDVHDKRQKIRELLKDHQLDPNETLFVGDMEHDIETAKWGGTRSCGVLTGFNTREQLTRTQPDLIVENLAELQSHLDTHPTLTGAAVGPDASELPEYPVPTVGALIYDPQGRVLMIQTHKWSDKWGIPGGKIHHGESSESALRREIREETNLEIESIRFVLVQDAIFPEEFYRPAHFLLMNYTCRAVPPLDTRLNHEAQRFQWVDPDQALEWDLNKPTRILLEEVLRSGAPNS